MSAAGKTCARCGATKPLDEFHPRNRGRGPLDVQSHCKACQSHRGGGQTQLKINRQRARHRAIADLIGFHEAEFETLYAIRLAEATDEAEALARQPHAQLHGEPLRLRPGRRKDGETAGDRIDVARCPHCVRHHDRGHRCAVCGATPTLSAPVADYDPYDDAVGAHADDRATEECRRCGGWTPGEPLSARLLCAGCEQAAQRQRRRGKLDAAS